MDKGGIIQQLKATVEPLQLGSWLCQKLPRILRPVGFSDCASVCLIVGRGCTELALSSLTGAGRAQLPVSNLGIGKSYSWRKGALRGSTAGEGALVGDALLEARARSRICRALERERCSLIHPQAVGV